MSKRPYIRTVVVQAIIIVHIGIKIDNIPTLPMTKKWGFGAADMAPKREALWPDLLVKFV